MPENNQSINTISYTSKEQIEIKVRRQREFFKKGITRSIQNRSKALKSLLNEINNYEGEIMEAMYSDFQKSNFEAFETEIGLVKSELRLAINKINNWSSRSFQGFSILSFPARLYSVSIPLGNTLIISPWNYPFLLALSPMIGSISAGNTVLLKPSELTEKTSSVIEKLIKKTFDPGHVDIVQGGVEESQTILNYSFDFIFFTGSTSVGNIIYKKAAEHLCPVMLELGGKSPCIINHDADIDIAARRIVWGKFLNAGQTCVAPDYLLIHTEVKDRLIEKIKYYIKKFYGEDVKSSPDYPRIINKKNFDRLKNLMSNENIVHGGNFDQENLFIEPCLVEIRELSAPLMEEEIFGPILPLLSFESQSDINAIISKNAKPLALYVFTENDDFANEVLMDNPSGDACINDVVSHFGEKKIGVGGIGTSGFGKYHGKKSFQVFSHQKSILKRGIWPDIPLRYPPYKKKTKLLKTLLNKI